jgi:hypothetical protein
LVSRKDRPLRQRRKGSGFSSRIEGAEAGAMLVACRLAGLSALGARYAGLNALPQ